MNLASYGEPARSGIGDTLCRDDCTGRTAISVKIRDACGFGGLLENRLPGLFGQRKGSNSLVRLCFLADRTWIVASEAEWLDALWMRAGKWMIVCC